MATLKSPHLSTDACSVSLSLSLSLIIHFRTLQNSLSEKYTFAFPKQVNNRIKRGKKLRRGKKVRYTVYSIIYNISINVKYKIYIQIKYYSLSFSLSHCYTLWLASSLKTEQLVKLIHLATYR